MSSEPVSTCINCGLPLTKNAHPDAGKMSALMKIGAMYGCLPCAERRAMGRQRLYSEFVRWLEDEIKYEDKAGRGEASLALERAKDKIEKLEEDRRVAFHKA